MATLAGFKFIFISIFGIPASLCMIMLSLFPHLAADININELPPVARYTFMLLGACYIWYIIMNARENYRKKKIDNDERERQLQEKHDRPAHRRK